MTLFCSPVHTKMIPPSVCVIMYRLCYIIPFLIIIAPQILGETILSYPGSPISNYPYPIQPKSKYYSSKNGRFLPFFKPLSIIFTTTTTSTITSTTTCITSTAALAPCLAAVYYAGQGYGYPYFGRRSLLFLDNEDIVPSPVLQ